MSRLAALGSLLSRSDHLPTLPGVVERRNAASSCKLPSPPMRPLAMAAALLTADLPQAAQGTGQCRLQAR